MLTDANNANKSSAVAEMGDRLVYRQFGLETLRHRRDGSEMS